MPLSRKKSCGQCRAAKVRCNLRLPSCSRCSHRALSCTYENISIGQSGPDRPSSNTVRGTNNVSGTPASSMMELSNAGCPQAVDCSKSTATEGQDVAINTGLCGQEFIENISEMGSGLTEMNCILPGSSPVNISSAAGAPDIRFDEIVSLISNHLTSL